MNDLALTAKLSRTYDVSRLVGDLRALERFIPVPQASDYHDGEWRGLCLIGVNGDYADAASGGAMGPFAETELLARTPYFRGLIEELPCSKRAVRLLFLPPGGRIRPHNDEGVSFESGFLRLHVPIVTHQDVHFILGGQRCEWLPGELWYGDFSQTHEVENRSPVLRVHLVLDVLLSRALLELFPEDLRHTVSSAGCASIEQPTAHLDESQLASLQGEIVIPRGALMSVSRASGSVTARIELRSGHLMFMLASGPELRIRPIGLERFALEGLPPSVELQLRSDGTSLAEASLRLAGLPAHFNYEPTAMGRNRARTTRVIPLGVQRR